jgi:hypothetical protein
MFLNVKLNARSATGYFISAYITVTILAYLASYLVSVIIKLPPDPPGGNMFDSPEFVKSVPYHLLINLLVWTAFSYIYFRNNQKRGFNTTAPIYLGLFWLLTAMLIHQFYVEYQPWISITYLIVFISPLLSYKLSQRKPQKE